MASADGENDIIPSKMSFVSSMAEDQITADAKVGIILVDFHTSLSFMVASVHEEEEKDDTPVIFSVRQIYKNLFILALALVLMFTAYSGITVLQSSLNTKDNIGVNSLIITNVLVIFSSIFFTGVCMDIFGLKWTIILAEIGYILYIIANIYPLPALMYTSAALVGLVAAPLWISQATYLSRIARYYSQHTHQTVDVIISLFFGIFFSIFGTSNIWGNLISYFILNQSNQPQKVNCGIYYDPKSVVPTSETEEVTITTRYVLCGIFAGMSIMSMLLLFFILDQVRLANRQPVRQSLKKSVEVLTSLFRWKHIDQFFLIPLTMWTLIEHGFLIAQFTRAFVTCVIGIRYIGLVMICNGICNAISSYVFAHLVKYIDRIGCFIVAALLNYAMIVLMFLWEPTNDRMVVIFVVAGVWGIAGAIWQSQVIATYTALYSESDPTALAKYRLWKTIGSLITYSYASYITIRLTLFLLIGYLTVGMIFYSIVEIHLRWKGNRKKADTTINLCL